MATLEQKQMVVSYIRQNIDEMTSTKAKAGEMGLLPKPLGVLLDLADMEVGVAATDRKPAEQPATEEARREKANELKGSMDRVFASVWRSGFIDRDDLLLSINWQAIIDKLNVEIVTEHIPVTKVKKKQSI